MSIIKRIYHFVGAHQAQGITYETQRYLYDILLLDTMKYLLNYGSCRTEADLKSSCSSCTSPCPAVITGRNIVYNNF